MYLYSTSVLQTFLINYPDRLISTLGRNNVAVDSKNRERSLLRKWKQPRGSWRLNWRRWVNFPLVLIHTSTLLTHFSSWTDNANSSSSNTEPRLFFFFNYKWRGQRSPLPPWISSNAFNVSAHMSSPVSVHDVFPKPPPRDLYFTPATVEHASNCSTGTYVQAKESDLQEKTLHTKDERELIYWQEVRRWQ